MVDKRIQIKDILKLFKGDLYSSSLSFWNTLGYRSTRYFSEQTISKDKFEDEIGADLDKAKFNKTKACWEKWDKVAALFQYARFELKDDTQQEIAAVQDRVDLKLFNSYIFLAIDIMSTVSITKTEYINITREVNKLLSMPIILLFRHQNHITVTIINRRLDKKKQGKKVLQKVILIKDVNWKEPHRGHLEILNKLCIQNLEVKSIKELHNAWQKHLSIKELNQDFYKDIINWYKSALELIDLKFENRVSDNDRKETKKHFLVKLLCRLMFCWFIKEKGLIPKEILELTNEKGENYHILKDNGDLSSNSYYRGILQPLFFECLNEPIDNRDFKSNRFFVRYWGEFVTPDTFRCIPYLNGGVFDRDDEFFEDNYKLNDNISDKDVSIPNVIFYGYVPEERTKSREKVILGLNDILNKYKFTIEENTPLEEDVALDPELLGMVFENLLAELDPDPDVSRNARRSSGSYYTPREVIDFMVNDSLVLYLQSKASEQKKNKYDEQIKYLVYYEIINDDPDFDEFVVSALDKLRILDPACGSGAFPMGMLHKITRILTLVDKDNSKWIKYKLKPIDESQKSDFAKHLREHYDNYTRKIGILRDSIFGIDIQPLAAHIAKLRFFISLIVDQKTDNKSKPNCGITPLPNLETNIICADSLHDIKPDIFEIDIMKDLAKSIKNYYRNEHTKVEKEALATEIAEDLSQAYQDFNWNLKKPSQERIKQYWKRWFQFGNVACPFFHMECLFPQVAEEKGFDIVIGNPPYGGTQIDDELKTELRIGSKDPYGAFIARFLNYHDEETPLKQNGILSFIVSDTFMTIKSHKDLRKQLLSNYIHKMIRVHPDTFKQVVNTSIILCQKAPQDVKIPDDHQCLMVDMTNVSVHTDVEKFIDILYNLEDVNKVKEYADNIYAIYKYKQNIINRCSLLPFFVAHAKFLVYLQDVDVERSKTNPNIRRINFNNRDLEIIRLADIAKVTQGLATGDNINYLYQTPESGKSYRNINEYKQYLLSEQDLERIRSNENVRLKVIENGIIKSKQEKPFEKDRWFDGRFIVPFDKGGASNSDSGWLPNYFVPTDFYIDWSSSSITRMKSFTIKDRDGTGKDVNCAVLRNTDTYFMNGISFSRIGMYAPTFRINARSVYDANGSMIIPLLNKANSIYLLGLLSSKLIKAISKMFIDHTVSMQVDDVKEIPVVLCADNDIVSIVKNIIEKQKTDPKYDYTNNEQKEIDKLVYELYGLNDDDIKEVENWYARRYPRLVKNNAVLDNQESLPASDLE